MESVDFDPGPDTFYLASYNNSHNTFITKFDVNGNLIWAKQLGGTISNIGRSICIDNYGNVYTTGEFRGTVDFDPGPGTFYLEAGGDWPNAFISKLDADGNFVWAKVLESGLSSYGYAIAIDIMGNLFTTGSFVGFADFDPGSEVFNLTSAGEDIFILKLTPNGDFIWAKQLGGTSHDGGYSIASDVFGNIYTTGYFRDTSDFDPGPDIFDLNSKGGKDIFISKLDSDGNFVWAKAIGGGLGNDQGLGISIDASGNVYTTGWFRGGVDFDPGSDVFNLTSSVLYDIFISKLDTDGNFVWAGKLGGAGANLGNDITIDKHGNIYTTGQFTSTADFDPGPSAFHLTSFGSRDVFVHKMKQCLSEATISSEGGGFEICRGDSLSLIMNEGISYTWSTGDTLASIQIAPEITTSYSVTLSDANQCVYMDTVTVTVHDLPEVFIEGEPEVCEGTNLSLTADGGEEYLWSTGESSASITVSPSADSDYHVTATDSFGCSDSDTINIAVLPLPEISISGETEACPGDTILLTASGGLEYLWNTGETTEAIEIIPTNLSEYSVTVTDDNGCIASAIAIVDVNTDYCPPCAEYAMPNVFTPGDDGVNDLFFVATAGEAVVRDFKIYSRWGNLVHHSAAPWDGKQDGHPLPSDVYIYMVTLETNCGIKQLRGEVSLLR